MSGVIAASAAAAVVTTAATVALAALPDTQALLAPLTDGNEYAVSALSILASGPILAAMAILAISGRE
ncbi:hypothetical protein [Hyphomicrobium sp.]|jgi:hypothetical protein|uniref:hypothetical protein n=1 Tax=Hyphomicrobium sp. TaxID=82 RepID=UPI002BD103F0|nr:hypothetical protein [Hyphomicrobium sp.]HVZ03484.1 hypothetical protein [Hyphomicrobium sp.]